MQEVKPELKVRQEWTGRLNPLGESWCFGPQSAVKHKHWRGRVEKKRKSQRKGDGGGQGAEKEKRKEGRRERRERAIAFPQHIVQKLEAGFRHSMRKVDGG